MCRQSEGSQPDVGCHCKRFGRYPWPTQSCSCWPLPHIKPAIKHGDTCNSARSIVAHLVPQCNAFVAVRQSTLAKTTPWEIREPYSATAAFVMPSHASQLLVLSNSEAAVMISSGLPLRLEPWFMFADFELHSKLVGICRRPWGKRDVLLKPNLGAH